MPPTPKTSLQQVFLRLIRRPNSAEPLDNQESYLRRAAINLSLDAIRNRQEGRSVPLDETLALQSASPRKRTI